LNETFTQNEYISDGLLASLTIKQAEILEYDLKFKPRHLILEGAIRSGKTILNVILFLLHVHKFRNQGKKFIITGTSIASIKRNVLDEIERLFEIPTALNQKNEFKLFGNTVCCFGADKSDSYKRMKGFTAHGWLGNEVTDHHKNSIDQAFKRCSGKDARIFWDTNPDLPTHFVKINFIDKSGSRLSDGRIAIKSFHFTLDDNDKLVSEYIEAVKQSTPAGMWYDRDIEGLWVAAEGIIYVDFNYEKHVISWDDLPIDDQGNLLLKNFFAGQDWGWTHKGVIGLYAFDMMGTCYRILEIAESQKGIEWWKAEALRLYGKYGKFPIYCPPDRPDLKNEYRQAGIVAEDADNAVFEGITFCAEQYKKENAFKVVRETNENFIQEVGWYRWADKLSKEEPVKERDDSMDSDRYARYSHIAHSNIASIKRWEDGISDLV